MSLILLGLIFFVFIMEPVLAAMDTQDKKLFTTFLIFELVDWKQTIEISRNDNYIELNPILGEKPSEDEINIYFLTCIGINYLIAKSDWKYKESWLKAAIALEVTCTTNNYRIGIRF